MFDIKEFKQEYAVPDKFIISTPKVCSILVGNKRMIVVQWYAYSGQSLSGKQFLFPVFITEEKLETYPENYRVEYIGPIKNLPTSARRQYIADYVAGGDVGEWIIKISIGKPTDYGFERFTAFFCQVAALSYNNLVLHPLPYPRLKPRRFKRFNIWRFIKIMGKIGLNDSCKNTGKEV